MNRAWLWKSGFAALLVVLGSGRAFAPAGAQDRLPSMPGYERYIERSRVLSGAARLASLNVRWLPDGSAFEYQQDGTNYRYDLTARKATRIEKLTPLPAETPRRQRPSPGFPERGRQYATALAPDGKRKAFYRDHNLWLSDADGKNETPITADGSAQRRIKYGTASWVYGEELNQTTAIWWSPDSRKVAFYRFDESKVLDYYLTLDTTKIQSRLDVEPYPKAGAANPIVDVMIYDVATEKTLPVDVRDGKPFTNEVVGHYVYKVQWSPDSKELWFYRTNRLQNLWEWAAADPQTGRCRVILREKWPDSWTDNAPDIQFFEDGRRFLLTSERNGWRNFYLGDVSGRPLTPVTQHHFEVERIVRLDEKAGRLYYMARSGDNPMKLQLHRVNLDGTDDRRLTDPALHHQMQLAPDGRHFIDTAQTHALPPSVRLVDAEGRILDTLTTSDLSRFEAEGFQKAEVFAYKAADGQTDLYGTLYKPSNFDPTRRYPLLVMVYGGPESGSVSERFSTPPNITELGFLVAEFDGRGTNGRGKRFKDAVYRKLGVVEIDDQAEGVKFLRKRPYVDGSRVGIFGVSYGGYAAIMCLLRHPEVFQAACASSSVTDWRNYDTIYTERYMGLPQENRSGYDAGSAMTYAGNLKGRLMLFYGTADNNVHPANTHQLIRALQNARKSFDLQIGPDEGHTGLNWERMLEFFMDSLGLATSAGALSGPALTP